MPSSRTIQIRMSSAHLRLLKQLSIKTGLDRTNVIRLALARLAESEGLLHVANKGDEGEIPGSALKSNTS